MTSRAFSGLLLLLGACATPQADAQHDARLARLDALGASGDRADAELDGYESRVASLHAQLDQLEQVWDRAEADLRRAQARMDRAAKAFGEASANYRDAAADYETAAKNYRRAAAALMLAASSDKAFRMLCDGKMSRAQVRRHWKKMGVRLDGKDADHIWPKSRGGADHVWNFQALDSRINRSIGNQLGWKVMNQPLALFRGAAVSALVSLRCG